MTTFSEEEILMKILYKLFNNRCFVKGHMLEEHIVSSVPKHDRGKAKEVLQKGVKTGLINIYGKTKHELHHTNGCNSM